MTSTVKVSIIIPVYNQEYLIKKTLQSVLNQDINSSFEILVIDDGSTDSTFDIVNAMSQKENCIKIFRQKHSGVSAARNLGISKCSGNYIYFFDSDDLIFKNYLNSQIEILENNKYFDIAICPFMTYSNNDKTFEPGFFFKDSFQLHIFQHNISPIICCLFRRCVIEKIRYFDTNLEALEDYDFIFRAAINNYKFIQNMNTLSIYRFHYDNSSYKIDWAKSYISITDKFNTIIEKKIRKYQFTEDYGYSLIYITFASSIIGYAVKCINKSIDEVKHLLDYAIKYLSLAIAHNDFKETSLELANLYICLIRNLSQLFMDYKPLSNMISRLADIAPQSFTYAATSEKLKELTDNNYIPFTTISSIFNSRIRDIQHLL